MANENNVLLRVSRNEQYTVRHRMHLTHFIQVARFSRYDMIVYRLIGN